MRRVIRGTVNNKDMPGAPVRGGFGRRSDTVKIWAISHPTKRTTRVVAEDASEAMEIALRLFGIEVRESNGETTDYRQLF